MRGYELGAYAPEKIALEMGRSEGGGNRWVGGLDTTKSGGRSTREGSRRRRRKRRRKRERERGGENYD